MGMNGYGCIVTTELLLALISINIFDKEKIGYMQNIDYDHYKKKI